jgi:hypothetical protein
MTLAVNAANTATGAEVAAQRSAQVGSVRLAGPAADVVRRTAAGPSVVGQWTRATNPGTQAIGIMTVLLNTGKVLLFGNVESGHDMTTLGYVYNPVTGTGHDLDVPSPVFCGGVVQLSDGRVLFVGGTSEVPKGTPDIWLFDPSNGSWTRQPDTVLGRYYPTLTRLPSGKVLITAGTEADGVTKNPTVELYTPPAAGQDVGTLQVVGPDHVTPYFPRQFVMPDGQLLQVRNKASYSFDPVTSSWTTLGQLPASAGNGAAAILLPGGPSGASRMFTVGGMVGGKALTATEMFDYRNRDAGWSRGTRLPGPRAHMNLVQVPDGSAYGIGGNTSGEWGGPTYRTLRYNPTTATWTRMAVQSVRRGYHSTALLLPDGRILSAGDNGTGGGGSRIDVYSPPYLFAGKRPVISSAPKSVGYRSTFTVNATGAAATRAVLMAPSATTHTNDMNARRVALSMKRVGDHLELTAPRDTLAPPGYYMLFLLSKAGVPSHAKWVHVGP